MIDVLEGLLETVTEEENQGVSLVIQTTPLPKLHDVISQFAEMEIEEETQVEHMNYKGSGAPLVIQSGQQMGEGRSPLTLLRQLSAVRRAARTAEGLNLRPREDGLAADSHQGTKNIPFVGVGGIHRQQSEAVDVARTVDRAIERDARRYDGGFLLG